MRGVASLAVRWYTYTLFWPRTVPGWRVRGSRPPGAGPRAGRRPPPARGRARTGKRRRGLYMDALSRSLYRQANTHHERQ